METNVLETRTVWNFESPYLDEINQIVELNFFFLDFESRISPRGIFCFPFSLNSIQHFLISREIYFKFHVFFLL